MNDRDTDPAPPDADTPDAPDAAVRSDREDVVLYDDAPDQGVVLYDAAAHDVAVRPDREDVVLYDDAAVRGPALDGPALDAAALYDDALYDDAAVRGPALDGPALDAAALYDTVAGGGQARHPAGAAGRERALDAATADALRAVAAQADVVTVTSSDATTGGTGTETKALKSPKGRATTKRVAAGASGDGGTGDGSLVASDAAPRRPGPSRRVLAGIGATVLVAGLAAVFLVDWGDKEPADTRFTVTEASNGAALTVSRGQEFVVRLQGSVEEPWTLPEANLATMARATTETLPDGSAVATFVPLDPVSAVVTATRVPLCADDTPPCASKSNSFQVTINVAE